MITGFGNALYIIGIFLNIKPVTRGAEGSKNTQQSGSIIDERTPKSGIHFRYVWVPELYPTRLRSQALMTCLVFGRIGPIFAPYVMEYLQVSYFFITGAGGGRQGT